MRMLDQRKSIHLPKFGSSIQRSKFEGLERGEGNGGVKRGMETNACGVTKSLEHTRFTGGTIRLLPSSQKKKEENVTNYPRREHNNIVKNIQIVTKSHLY